MTTVDTSSLAATLDALNESFFENRPLSRSERERAARWIAGRQGLAGSYQGMFAPTERDFRDGITFFTGERLHTRGGSAHILGEEACRALILLDVTDQAVTSALERATASMSARLGKEDVGRYCCGKCSVALWRHLAAGGLAESGWRLSTAAKTLRNAREGTGRWRAFPFHYTLLVLSEMGLQAAVTEMRYAAPVLERMLKRPVRENKFADRRRRLAERVLARC